MSFRSYELGSVLLIMLRIIRSFFFSGAWVEQSAIKQTKPYFTISIIKTNIFQQNT
jgi:hypothetical protein